MRRSRKPLQYLVLATGILLTICAGCTKPVPPKQDSIPKQVKASLPSPTADYVADSSCAACHAELFESYQQVGMANSFYPPSARPTIEDFENSHYHHRPSDRHYAMSEENGELFQHRYQLDAEGNKVNELKMRVDWVLGSGNHIRSYLYQTPAGELFQMPLAWYSKSQRWRMNPGYDKPQHQGFHRKVNRECMFCHNAYPVNAEPGSDRHWEPYVFPKELPHGIGCQRCHGPGKQHVELAEAGAATVKINEVIVNPSDLSAELQHDVCMQCHMQPSSQILSELVRADRTEYSYRPGEPLSDYRALLDYEEEGATEDRFEINHHAYRMRKSECFIESQGKLSCVTCHDPHQKVSEQSRIAHYREACLQCHSVPDCQPAVEIESGDSALSDCASCHMPTRRTHDVIHATMTDHKIVAEAASEEERLKTRSEPPVPSSKIEPQAYELASNDEVSTNDIELYKAIAGSQLGNISSIRSLINYVRAQRDKPNADVYALPFAELVDALRNQGDIQGEVEVLRRAVKRFPDRAQPNLELAMALAAAGVPEEALIYYKKAISVGPPLPEAYVGIGMSLLQRNDPDGAAENFRKAIQLSPWNPEALLNLGIVLHYQEKWAEARDYLEKALAADPTFTEASEYLDRIPLP